jgi:hypothetical protein
MHMTDQLSKNHELAALSAFIDEALRFVLENRCLIDLAPF